MRKYNIPHNFELITIIELYAQWIREGKLKVNSDWNKDLKVKFTIQDPCNVGRKSGSDKIVNELRFVLKTVVGEENFIDISGNRISGFPNFLANIGFSFIDAGFYFRLTGKYVGEFFSDNYDTNLNIYVNQFPGFVDYSDNLNKAYFVSDFYASYEFNFLNGQTPWKIFVQVNNIFDELYSAYAIGKEFFPAAERNWLAGIQIGL